MDLLAAARARLQKLEATRSATGAEAYERERRLIEREVGDFLLSPSAGGVRVRPPRALAAALASVVVVVAVAGYVATGTPQAARPGANVAAAANAGGPGAAASGSDAANLQQIEAMVDKLAARVKERPDDAQGWAMLARSYAVLGRFADSLPAYAKATALQPKSPNLLADYADATAAAKARVDNPETLALIERALAVDPDHPKALALSGTAAYERGDYAKAVSAWQRIAVRLPPGSETARQVEASIADAQARAATGAASAPAAALARAPSSDGAPAVGSSADSRPTATGSAAHPTAVSGTVQLDPALRASASPTDTVFVYARPASGGRMPLAVQKATVADLPLTFRLDDSMAMAPGMTISSAERVVVSARISKSGNAMPQAGDLSGESAPVAPGASGLQIRIDHAVAAR